MPRLNPGPVTSLTITNADGTAAYQHLAADQETSMFFRATQQSDGVPDQF
jgi:hypothetical protein